MLVIIMLTTLFATMGFAHLVILRFDRAHQPAVVRCDRRGQRFEADILVRPRSFDYGERYEVARCSAFAEPGQVTCDERCLEPRLASITRT